MKPIEIIARIRELSDNQMERQLRSDEQGEEYWDFPQDLVAFVLRAKDQPQ